MGRIVKSRIESLGECDFPAAEARYHKTCKTQFLFNFDKEGKQTEDPSLLALFDEMSLNRDKIWNSVELHQEYVSLGGSCVTSRERILTKIQSYYCDKVSVFSSPGLAKIVCFKTETTKSLHLVKQEDCESENADLDAAVSKVADKIVAETKYQKTKRENYTIKIDKEVVQTPVSETLLELLHKVSSKFCDSLPSLLIGNIVASIITGSPTDLQIALGIAMRRNKTLVQLLHEYQVTCSYDEILLFKYSAAVASATAVSQDIFDQSGKIIHCCPDNFDCEINSENCKNHVIH